MGCETECERENQEGPRETKGDTEKLSKIFLCRGKQVFSMLFWLVHTNQNLRKKGKKKNNLSHVANTGD